MSTSWRVAIAVALVAAAVAGFLLVRDSDESAPTHPVSFGVSVPAGGPTHVERLEAAEGQRVILDVVLAKAGEVHVHGYDLMEETGPGEPPAHFDFVADEAGAFEIEIEDTSTQIAELRVNP